MHFEGSLQCVSNQEQAAKFRTIFSYSCRGPKIAVCETTSDKVFVLNSAFTNKDNYFQAAIDEAIDAFNAVLRDFGYSQQLQRYNPDTHQVHPLVPHPFWSTK